MSLSLLRILAIALTLTGLVTGVGPVQAEAVLYRGNGAEPETIDPHKSTGVPEANLIYELYEGLITYGPQGEVRPGVAERWEVSDDGRIYTFHLRENAKWSNGDPVTAEDFVYSFRRALDPATAADYGPILDPIRNATAIRKGEEKDTRKLGVAAIDAHTLTITLINPTPYFLGLVRHHIALPVHRASVERFGADFNKPGNLVSNGAFMLSEWMPQASLTMVRNPNYWDAGNVKLDKIVYYPTEDIAEEFKRFQAGELDVTYQVPLDQIKWIRAHLPDQYKNVPYLGTYHYRVNLTREPLGSHPDLRRALALAIDRELLTEKITQGGEQPAYSWCPPITGYRQASMDFKDMPASERIADAKALLAKNGYGPGNPLKVELLYNTSESHKKIAIAIQSMWKRIGVEATIINQEWKVYLDSRDQKQFEIVRAGWIGDFDDPITFLDLFLADAGERNDIGYNNPKYDELIHRSAAMTDPAERMNVLNEAEQLLLDDVGLIPIYHYTTNHMVAARVAGWGDNILDIHLARYMALRP